MTPASILARARLVWKAGPEPDDVGPIMVAADAYISGDDGVGEMILTECGYVVVGKHVFRSAGGRELDEAAEMSSILSKRIYYDAYPPIFGGEGHWDRSVLILSGEDDDVESPLDDLERSVRGGSFIEKTSTRTFIQDVIDHCDPYRREVDPLVWEIWRRMEVVKETSRENEGGPGWMNSNCEGYPGAVYDNWLESGC